MKMQLTLFILLLCCPSCASQKKEIIAKSTIKLEGRNTNIRDLIEIDGYYSNPVMFFEDGTYVANFSFKEGLSENEIKANMSKSLSGKQFSWGNYWGAYRIEGDTLIVYHYLRGSFWTPWYFDEVRYKVIDRTTIQKIYWKGLLKIDEQYYKDTNKSPWIKNGDKLYFNSADSLPSSDCWLKEKKWIWRNESDWKAYMEKIKQKKQ